MTLANCSTSCGICLEVKGDSTIPGYKNIVHLGRNIISETNGFLLIPSVGPLNESHVMLVPKRHVNAFGGLSENELKEALNILHQLNSFVKNNKNKSLIFFESGAGTNIDHSGGCIYHAHIHCVCYTKEFEDALLKEIPFVTANILHYDVDHKNGYVWFMNNQSNQYICNNPLLPSQFLRYLYANTNSINISWNWRRDNNVSGINKVIDYYKEFSTELNI